MNQLRRRADIQGLRAIAVLFVVANHANLGLPGGFVGVDIFFVISGFVISASLKREFLERGSLNLKKFYLARFARLAPALAILNVFVALSSFLFLSPFGPVTKATMTVVTSQLMASNWFIALGNINYFEPAAATNPLLHTWSLGVEEQFYLVAPLLLLVLVFRTQKRVPLRQIGIFVCCLVALLSLAASIASAIPNSGSDALPLIFGYYSLFPRIWEFTFGVMIALVPASRLVLQKRPTPEILIVLGAVGLICSVVCINSTASYPGFLALIPTLATVALIVAGFVKNPLSQALGSKWLTRVGDASYSIYLWHWPLIVFAKVLFPESEWAPAIAALVSFVPAFCSYAFIESKLRRSLPKLSEGRWRLVSIIALAPIVISLVLLGISKTVVLPKVMSTSGESRLTGDLGYEPKKTFLEKNAYACTPQAIRNSSSSVFDHVRCDQSKRDTPVEFALVGDSHAEQLFFGFQKALPSLNVAYYMDGNLPIFGQSKRMNQILDFVLKSSSVKYVVLNAAWEGRGIDEKGLEDVSRKLAAADKQVFITDDNPIFTMDAFACKYRQSLLLGKRCNENSNAHLASAERIDGVLKAIKRRVPSVTVLEGYRNFCLRGTCSMRNGNTVLYADNGHLNIGGSNFLVKSYLEKYPQLSNLVR